MKFDTYFWIQKKNEKNENMVVINGSFSSFDKLPQEIRSFNPNRTGEILLEETDKTKISVQLKRRKIATERKDIQIVCVRGWINERDSSNRNIAYTFYFVTQEKINPEVLIEIERQLKKCMEMTNSAESFDECDFRKCLSQVDLQKCNDGMIEMLKRDYESGDLAHGVATILKKTISDPKIIVGTLALAGICAAKSLSKKKKW